MASNKNRDNTLSRSIRVLMIIERYHPVWGGAENQLYQLIPALTDKGCEVDVVTRRWSRDLAAEELVNGVRVKRIGIAGETLPATILFSLSLLINLILFGRKYNILHSHGAVKMGTLCKAATMIGRNKNVAKIATGGKVQPLTTSVPGRLLLACFKRSDAVICMSREIKEEMVQIGIPERIMVSLPNAVDCSKFTKETDEGVRKRFRAAYDLPENIILVLFVGRIVQRKGIDVLLKAWELLDPVPWNMYLMIVGSGKGQSDSVEEELKEYAREKHIERVVFTGSVDSPEAVYANCDLFVFPSRREGFPNALMEAMAAGLPAVATRIGGNIDLITDGETGLLFDREDHVALAAIIGELLSDANKMEALGIAARKAMQETYDFSSVAAGYRALYDRLS